MDNEGIKKAIDKVLSLAGADNKPLMYNKFKISKDRIFIVLMMGPRRCGKTSVLTSVSRCIKQVSAESSIVCTPRGEYKKFFQDKEEELIEFADSPANYINGAKGKPGIAATSEISSYDFVLYHEKNPKNLFMLRFIDANGEFYKDYPDEMKRLVQKSDMIIVAVDTPALMMDNQSLSMRMNGYNIINDYFSELELDEDERTTKLVLFTPLKCEYLYRRDEDVDGNPFMDDVAVKIQNEYRQMITKLTNNTYNDLISIAITPVLTIGGVKFISYETDDNSEYKKDDNGLAMANYVIDPQHRGYHPKYCEQPIYYLLTFMNNLIDEYKKSNESDFIKILKRVPLLRMLIVDKDRKFVDELNRVSDKIVKDVNGYKVISDKKGRLKKA